MRLDKYLKATRLIKRRTIANEACDAGRVLVNGKVARASYEVKEDDAIEIQLGQRSLKVQVVSVTESPRKEEAAQNYKVIEAARLCRFLSLRCSWCLRWLLWRQASPLRANTITSTWRRTRIYNIFTIIYKKRAAMLR